MRHVAEQSSSVSSDPAEAISHALLPPPVGPTPAFDTDRSLTLSYSQVDEYMTCPERYRLRYDIGIPTPAHHALSYGSAIHQAIAAFHSAQSRGVTLTDEELVAELRRAWQPDGFLSREHEDARFAAGADALRRFRTQQLASGAHLRSQQSDHLPSVWAATSFAAASTAWTRRTAADHYGLQIIGCARPEARRRKGARLAPAPGLRPRPRGRDGTAAQRVQLHFVESGVVGRAAPTQERFGQGTRQARRHRGSDPDAPVRAQTVGHHLRLLPVQDDLHRQRRVISEPEPCRPPHKHAPLRSRGAVVGGCRRMC